MIDDQIAHIQAPHEEVSQIGLKKTVPEKSEESLVTLILKAKDKKTKMFLCKPLFHKLDI